MTRIRTLPSALVLAALVAWRTARPARRADRGPWTGRGDDRQLNRTGAAGVATDRSRPSHQEEAIQMPEIRRRTRTLVVVAVVIAVVVVIVVVALLAGGDGGGGGGGGIY